MTQISAVISDLGGVLTTPIFPAFAAIGAELEISGEDIGQALAVAADRHGGHPLVELETGRMAFDDFISQIELALREVTGREFPVTNLTDRLWEALDLNHGFLAELQAHGASGVTMAMLTNNVREWSEHWRSLFDVDALFSVVVDSAFVGMRKPDRNIYEFTLDRLSLPAEACVFIDDLEINIIGARDVGLHTIHFQDTEQAIGELRALIGDPVAA